MVDFQFCQGKLSCGNSNSSCGAVTSEIVNFYFLNSNFHKILSFFWLYLESERAFIVREELNRRLCFLKDSEVYHLAHWTSLKQIFL